MIKQKITRQVYYWILRIQLGMWQLWHTTVESCDKRGLHYDDKDDCWRIVLDKKMNLNMEFDGVIMRRGDWWQCRFAFGHDPTCQMKENCEANHDVNENRKGTRNWSRKSIFWYYSVMFHKNDMWVHRIVTYCQLS